MVKRRAREVGHPPSVLPEPEEGAPKPTIRLTVYSREDHSERPLEDIKQAFPFPPPPTVTWLDIVGHDPQVLEALGENLGLHPLVLEDIATPGQRPKLEDYGEHLFLVLHMLRNKRGGEVVDEQVALILGPSWLVSVQEREGDVFDPARERIRSGKGRIRKLGADYLLYALLDMVVDGYFLILEALGDPIEQLEEEVLAAPGPQTAQRIHHLKRRLLFVRKSVWPLREAVEGLTRSESPLVGSEVRLFLRDVYDHTIQVLDMVETLRDMGAGLLDVYLTSTSNRLNEVMKVLTVIATIFMPLTFIAGIYGMNFQYMPELSWPWGYFGVLGLMALVALAMLIYFRRKRWL